MKMALDEELTAVLILRSFACGRAKHIRRKYLRILKRRFDVGNVCKKGICACILLSLNQIRQTF